MATTTGTSDRGKRAPREAEIGAAGPSQASRPRATASSPRS